MQLILNNTISFATYHLSILIAQLLLAGGGGIVLVPNNEFQNGQILIAKLNMLPLVILCLRTQREETVYTYY